MPMVTEFLLVVEKLSWKSTPTYIPPAKHSAEEAGTSRSMVNPWDGPPAAPSKGSYEQIRGMGIRATNSDPTTHTSSSFRFPLSLEWASL